MVARRRSRLGRYRCAAMEPARPRPDAARRPVPDPTPARRPAPARLQPVVDLAPAARGSLFSRLDGAAWARYRNPIPLLEGPVRWSELLDNPDLLAEYQSILREFDAYLANGSDHWFQRQHADRPRRPDRLLLRRVRLPRVARDLLGRARRAGRRPHEVGQRHGPAVRRRRAALPQGLLPPDDRRRRPPGARLPGLRPQPPAAPAGSRRRRRRRSWSRCRCPIAT